CKAQRNSTRSYCCGSPSHDRQPRAGERPSQRRRRQIALTLVGMELMYMCNTPMDDPLIRLFRTRRHEGMQEGQKALIPHHIEGLTLEPGESMPTGGKGKAIKSVWAPLVGLVGLVLV